MKVLVSPWALSGRYVSPKGRSATARGSHIGHCPRPLYDVVMVVSIRLKGSSRVVHRSCAQLLGVEIGFAYRGTADGREGKGAEQLERDPRVSWFADWTRILVSGTTQLQQHPTLPLPNLSLGDNDSWEQKTSFSMLRVIPRPWSGVFPDAVPRISMSWVPSA